MLQNILSSISKKMTIDFQDITKQIYHNGEKGNAREDILSRFLDNYLPDKYSVCKGTIISSDGAQSKQQDIIIYDRFTCPVLLDTESTKFIPIEAVYATIEVKSTLSKKELRKSIKNVKSVREMQQASVHGYIRPIYSTIFAYTTDSTLGTVFKNFNELNDGILEEHQTCSICLLDNGVIISINKSGLNQLELIPTLETTRAFLEDNDNALLLFYLILMQALNQVKISPPNLMKYAGVGEEIKIHFTIPEEFIPLTGHYNLGDKIITTKEMQIMHKIQEKFKVIHEGKATLKQFVEFFRDYFEEFMRISSNGKTDSFEIYGLKCDYDDFIKSFKVEKPTENDLVIKAYEHYKLDFSKR